MFCRPCLPRHLAVAAQSVQTQRAFLWDLESSESCGKFKDYVKPECWAHCIQNIRFMVTNEVPVQNLLSENDLDRIKNETNAAAEKPKGDIDDFLDTWVGRKLNTIMKEQQESESGNDLDRAIPALLTSSTALKTLQGLQKDARRAFRFFLRTCEMDGLKRDRSLKGLMISILQNSKEFDVAWEVLRDARNSGKDCGTGPFKVLIKSYAVSGMEEKAFEAFDRMDQEFSVKADAGIYNILLQMLANSGAVDLAKTLYREKMLKEGCRPNRSTFMILLHGFCNSGQVSDALALFDEMSAMGIGSPDARISTIVFHGLCKAGMLDEANKLFESMMKNGCNLDMVSYNIIIDGYCILGQLDRALRLLHSFEECDVKPNEITFNTLLNGLIQAGQIDDAIEHFRRHWLEAGVPPGMFSVTLITNGLYNAGRFEDAVSWMNFALGNFDSLDTFCYNTLMNGICKGGLVEMAHTLKFKLEQKGCQPDVVTFNILINGYCKHGLLDDAYTLFEEMKTRKIAPNITTYNTLLDGLCKAGQVDKAQILFYQMGIGENPSFLLGMVQGAEPVLDSTSFEALSARLCSSGKISKAYKLVRRLLQSGVVPNVVTYNTLINGLCKANKLDEALRHFKLMLIRGYVPQAVTYNTLIHGLWRVNRDEDAYILFEQMAHKSCPPNEFTYDLLITLMITFLVNSKLSKAFHLWVCYLSQRVNFQSDKMQMIQKSFEEGKFEEAFETVLKLHMGLDHVDARAYSVIVSGLSESGKSDVALKLLGIIQKHNLVVTKTPYSVLVYEFCKKGNPMAALQVFKESLNEGVLIDPHAVGELLYSLCDQNMKNMAIQVVNLLLNSDYYSHLALMVKTSLY